MNTIIKHHQVLRCLPRFGILAMLLSTCVTPIHAAKSLSITDKLTVGLYESKTKKAPPIKLLTSGTSLKAVVTGNIYSKVKTSDGVIGWVKTKYLTNDIPISQSYAELKKRQREYESTIEQLQKKITALSKQNNNTGKVIDKQQIPALLAKTQADLTAANNRITVISSEKDALTKQAAVTSQALTKRINTLLSEVAQLRKQNISEEDRDMASVEASLEEMEIQAKNQEIIKTKTAEIKRLMEKSKNTDKQLDKQIATYKSLSKDADKMRQENTVLWTHMKKASDLLNVKDMAYLIEQKQAFLSWELWALLGLLPFGFFLGFAWFDYRLRKRHGGYRIY